MPIPPEEVILYNEKMERIIFIGIIIICISLVLLILDYINIIDHIAVPIIGWFLGAISVIMILGGNYEKLDINNPEYSFLHKILTKPN